MPFDSKMLALMGRKGGGSGSWNDLTDKPFWTDVSDSFTILENQAITEEHFDGEAYRTTFPIERGFGRDDVVTIHFNDKKYTARAFFDGSNYYASYYADDFQIDVGCLVEDGVQFIIIACPTAGNITVTACHETVHLIDPKYIWRYATPIIDVSVLASSLTLAGYNNDLNYENFGTEIANQFELLRDAILWGYENSAAFWCGSNRINAEVRPGEEWSNGHDYIWISNYEVFHQKNKIWRQSYEYNWYLDDEGQVWGACVTNEETFIQV